MFLLNKHSPSGGVCVCVGRVGGWTDGWMKFDFFMANQHISVTVCDYLKLSCINPRQRIIQINNQGLNKKCVHETQMPPSNALLDCQRYWHF